MELASLATIPLQRGARKGGSFVGDGSWRFSVSGRVGTSGAANSFTGVGPGRLLANGAISPLPGVGVWPSWFIAIPGVLPSKSNSGRPNASCWRLKLGSQFLWKGQRPTSNRPLCFRLTAAWITPGRALLTDQSLFGSCTMRIRPSKIDSPSALPPCGTPWLRFGSLRFRCCCTFAVQHEEGPEVALYH